MLVKVCKNEDKDTWKVNGGRIEETTCRGAAGQEDESRPTFQSALRVAEGKVSDDFF